MEVCLNLMEIPLWEATGEGGTMRIVLCDRVLSRGTLAVPGRIMHLKMYSLKI